jgi:chemotaxis protein histidine kinase CheA
VPFASEWVTLTRQAHIELVMRAHYFESMHERAVATGIYGAGEVQNVPDEEIARLIFMDNISTQKEVTELAGRGVGLAAVLIETKNLGGEVLVKTVAGGGTQFLFNLPWLQEPLHNEVRS